MGVRRSVWPKQMACVHLIGDFARREGLVREAARAGLTNLSEWDDGDQQNRQIASAAKAALSCLG